MFSRMYDELSTDVFLFLGGIDEDVIEYDGDDLADYYNSYYDDLADYYDSYYDDYNDY
jgi:hypothetical protein